jgi:GcrA cell cycle regulator
MIWDNKAISRLKELCKTGISFTRIGLKMGISKNAAIGKAARLKLNKSPAPSVPIARKLTVFTPKPLPKTRALLPKEIPPTPPVSVSIPEMRLVTMMQLTDQHCRYPIDTPTGILFCGRAPDGQPPYCQAHAKLCYMPPRPLNRSARTLLIQAQLR